MTNPYNPYAVYKPLDAKDKKVSSCMTVPQEYLTCIDTNIPLALLCKQFASQKNYYK